MAYMCIGGRGWNGIKSPQMHGMMNGLHEGGGQGWNGVKAVDHSQGGAHQGVEGLAKHLVGHPGGAKGDAAHISIWVFQSRPGCTCSPYRPKSAFSAALMTCKISKGLVWVTCTDRQVACLREALAQHHDEAKHITAYISTSALLAAPAFESNLRVSRYNRGARMVAMIGPQGHRVRGPTPDVVKAHPWLGVQGA